MNMYELLAVGLYWSEPEQGLLKQLVVIVSTKTQVEKPNVLLAHPAFATQASQQARALVLANELTPYEKLGKPLMK